MHQSYDIFLSERYRALTFGEPQVSGHWHALWNLNFIETQKLTSGCALFALTS